MITNSVNVADLLVVSSITPNDPFKHTIAYTFNSGTTCRQMHCLKCSGSYPHHFPGCPEEIVPAQ